MKNLRATLHMISEKVLAFFGSKTFFYIIIGWFAFQLIFMGLSTTKGIAPDEGTHIRTIALYAGDGFDPFIQYQPPEAYQLGGVTRSPSYFYHYVMSFPYRVLPASMPTEDKMIFLRMINLVFALAGVLILSRALALVSKQRITQNLTLFMLTNTLMFVFLSSSINYDNMVFMLVSACFYYLLKLYKKLTLPDIVKLGIVMLMLSVVKFTFLPLGLIMLLSVVIMQRKNVLSYLKQLPSEVRKQNKYFIILAVIFAIFFGFFIERYGVNYARYGTYKPQCDKVMAYENCLSSGLFVRNLAFRDNPVTSNIPDANFSLRWAERMKEGVYGILGHKFADETLVIKLGSIAVAALFVVAIIRKFTLKETVINMLLLIALIYTAVLLWHNYTLFTKSGRFGLALQGRYVFPVLPLYYLAGTYYLHKWLHKEKIAYAITTVAIVVIFFLGSLPAYIVSTNRLWHTNAMQGINSSLKKVLILKF